MIRTSLSLLALVSLASVAAAEETSVGLGLSSLGYAAEGTVPLDETLTFRGMLFLSPSESLDESFDDADGNTFAVTGNAQLGGLALLADYYPMGHGWRFSGGLFVSNTDVSTTFTGPETFDAQVDFKNPVTLMGTGGYVYEFGDGWYVSGEAGIILSELEATTNSADPDVLANVNDINSDLSELPVVPFGAVMVGFNF